MRFTLLPPFEISSRLLPAVRVGDACISIEYGAGGLNGHRQPFTYYIDLPDGTEYSGTDLEIPEGRASIQSGMENILCFIVSAAETYDYFLRNKEKKPSEPFLFPEPVCKWARDHRDEIEFLREELEEHEGLVIES
jgi:hypothetical protein